MEEMIKSKADALAFLKSHKEFSDQDWIEGEFWFRYDGVTEPVYGMITQSTMLQWVSLELRKKKL